MNKKILAVLAIILIAGLGLYVKFYGSGGTQGRFTYGGSSAGSGTGLYITNNSVAASFSPGDTDFEVMNLNFENRNDADLEITQLKFNIGASGEGLLYSATSSTGRAYSTASYTNIELVDSTGTAVLSAGSISTFGSDSTQVITFTGSWTITAGDNVDVALRTDVENSSTLVGSRLTANLRVPNTIAKWLTSIYVFKVTTDIYPGSKINSGTNTCI
jgi:hypothetical protein